MPNRVGFGLAQFERRREVLARFGELGELGLTCGGITTHGVQAAGDGQQITHDLSGQLLGAPGHTFRASWSSPEGQGGAVSGRILGEIRDLMIGVNFEGAAGI